MINKNGRPMCWNCETQIEVTDLECRGCGKELDGKEKIGFDPEVCTSCGLNLCDNICINGCQTKELALLVEV